MWTITALVSEIATKRIGVMAANVWRLLAAMICSALLMLVTTGEWWPVYADNATWIWMLLSGFIGYFLGDWCLFNSYLVIGSRYGQLFMTLAPVAAALSGMMLLGQHLSMMNIIAMMVVLIGIAIAIMPDKKKEDTSSAGSDTKKNGSLPLKGILFGIGAGVGQGLGLVISKIGMNAYEESLSLNLVADATWNDMMPFSANMIRCIAGFVCFMAWTMLRHETGDLKKIFHDRKAAAALSTAVMFGPFLGVGISLIAVQYTAAGIASTLMALTPIIIILPSYWIFRQPITAKGIIGAVISVAGGALFFV